MAHVIFLLFTGEYCIISLVRWCEGDSLISSISRDTLSTNETNEKENFDDWYIITTFVVSS